MQIAGRSGAILLSAILLVPILLMVIPLALPAFAQTNVPFKDVREKGCPTNSCSLNWAGYAITGSTDSVTDVKGSFTVPSVSCSSSNADASFWVGIDGYNDGTVEQTGVNANPCDANFAPPGYSAWYEFYPAAPVYASFAVVPGDVVKAEVTFSPVTGIFTSTLTVTTSAGTTVGTLTQSQTVSGAKAQSAEWITEAPSSGRILPLANFGTAFFTSSSAKIGGTTGSISGFPHVYKITMVTKTGVVKALPSALDGTGQDFSVAWKHS